MSYDFKIERCCNAILLHCLDHLSDVKSGPPASGPGEDPEKPTLEFPSTMSESHIPDAACGAQCTQLIAC